MRRHSSPPSNASSNDHHTLELDVLAAGAASPTEENADQGLMGGNDTSRRKICLSWLRSKFRSFNFHRCLRRKIADDDKQAKVQLWEAAKNGDWKTAEEIEKKHSGILSKVVSKDRNETALHIATRFKQASFVAQLVQKLTQQDLEATNVYQNTALCIAATSGAVGIAKSMVEKHKDLVLIGDIATPVLIALRYKHKKMVNYLLDQMQLDNFLDKAQKTKLLLGAISADYYDIALLILEREESLALERDINGYTPLHIMAPKSNAIASYHKTTKWQSYANNTWFKRICKKTTMQIKAHEMVTKMWSIVKSSASTREQLMDFIKDPSSTSMLHEAARVGNVGFLEVLLHANPELLRMANHNGKTIFHVAVENRQESVFSLIYDMKLFNPDDVLYYFDEENIHLLDLAAKRADPCHLDRVSGAVFQMHSELLWFKEVEKIVELTTRLRKKGEQTAREIFSEEHRGLREEGEKWVKRTANSCMLVATLIATVAFAAAFTVPGGKDEIKGIPILLEHKWFSVFVISDGIAMISSSAAILLFLSILTSRCAENDFLFWLPLELALGLGFLFLSVLGMVLAFGATFFLYYGKDTASLPLLIIGMAIVPIFWFCVLQWKLWAHALVSLHATADSCWLRNRKPISILKTITRGIFVH